jgi:ELWxxDGT repeat protein
MKAHAQRLRSAVSLQTLEARRLMAVDFRTADSTPRSLLEFNGNLYFQANDGVHGHELWRSDGTEAGTFLLKDLVPGPAAPRSISGMFSAGGKLHFIVDGHFWESDGTTEGTFQVGTKLVGSLYSPSIFNNDIYFTGSFDGQTGLFKTDWTDGGTTLVAAMKDFRSGPVVGAAGMMIVARDISVQQIGFDRPGYSLFVSDGTSKSTHKTDITTTYFGQISFQKAGDTLIMGVRPSFVGTTLYTTDGTLQGTQLFIDQNASNIVSLGDKIIYTVGEGTTNQLWVTDGTEQGTHFLKTLTQSSGVGVRVSGGVAFLYTSYTGVLSITRTDGTVQGTVDVDLTGVPIENTQLAAAGGHLYFSTGGVSKLWRTNDAGTGVELVADVELQAVSAIDYNGKLVFSSNGETVGDEPWITAGTAAGTHLIKDINTLAKLARPNVKSDSPYYDGPHGPIFGATTIRFVGLAPAGATVVLFYNSREVGRGVADEDGRYVIAPTAPASSLRLVAVVADENGNASPSITSRDTLNVDLDGMGARVQVNDLKSPIELSFDETLTKAVTVDDLILQELGQGIVIDREHLQLTELNPNHTLYTLTYDGGAFPVGDYRLTFVPGAILDRVGNDVQTAFQHWIVKPPVVPPPVPPTSTVFSVAASGALSLHGTDGDDLITVADYSGSRLLVSVNGVRHLYARSNVTSLDVFGGSGNDRINLSGASLGARVDAGAGNDVVYGSQAADRINGRDGDDWLSGLGGNDTIYGQAGADKLFGGAGRDYLNDTAGSNVFRSGGSVDRIVAALGLSDLKSNKGDSFSFVN